MKSLLLLCGFEEVLSYAMIVFINLYNSERPEKD